MKGFIEVTFTDSRGEKEIFSINTARIISFISITDSDSKVDFCRITIAGSSKYVYYNVDQTYE